MSEHENLVVKAKQDQVKKLQATQWLSKQLSMTISQLVRANSTDLSLVDKITTIHELNDQIDAQLNTDLAINYALLKELELKLSKSNEKMIKVLKNGLIENLQSRSELIDQELRILENTLKLIKRNDEME